MASLDALKTWLSFFFMVYGVYWVLPFKISVHYKPWMRPREPTKEQQQFIRYLVSKIGWVCEKWAVISAVLSIVGSILLTELYIPGYGEYALLMWVVVFLVGYVVDDDYHRWRRKQVPGVCCAASQGDSETKKEMKRND